MQIRSSLDCGKEKHMGTLTIRNLDDRVKQELRKRAAEHGVSMEEEARTILRDAVTTGDRSASSESMMGALDRLKAKYGASSKSRRAARL
jgi:plasmid stability protein